MCIKGFCRTHFYPIYLKNNIYKLVGFNAQQVTNASLVYKVGGGFPGHSSACLLVLLCIAITPKALTIYG